MTFKLKLLLIPFLILVFFVFGASQKTLAFNFFGKDVCTGEAAKEPKNGGSSVCKTNNEAQFDNRNNNAVTRTINAVANIVASIAGVFAVLNIIVGGFQFVTAGGVGFKGEGGVPTKVANARSRIVYSLIGLVVVALAWTITRFITNQVLQ